MTLLEPLRRPIGVAALLWVALAACGAQARCLDEGAGAPPTEVLEPAERSLPDMAPPLRVAEIIRQVQARNAGVEAARLLAEAAQQDVQEARAAAGLQASLVASMTPVAGNQNGKNDAQLQTRAGVSLTKLLYDGGRNDLVVDWRARQAEVARLGQISTQERLALTTFSLLIERSRYRMQARVYGQYVRSTTCLMQALEAVVAVDKGRTSELVQARKQVQQANLQLAQVESTLRQLDVKLTRFVGDGPAAVPGLSTLMRKVPALPDALAQAERATDIAQMDASASALVQAARVVEVSMRPTVSLNVGGTAQVTSATGPLAAVERGHGTQLSAGVTLAIPLLNPGVDHSIQAARRRADAARQQRLDALESRRSQIAEVHEQASAAFDRVGRITEVLRDTDRLRQATLMQWQQLGRRSLFDVVAAESEHVGLRVQYVNALHDGQQMNAVLSSLGLGVMEALR